MRISLILLSLLLGACGGGDYSVQANRAPVANAGPPQTVAAEPSTTASSIARLPQSPSPRNKPV